MATKASPMVEETLRVIEAERVKQRLRPLALCRKAGVNDGCYLRMLRERGGRISSLAAILDALGLELKVVYKSSDASPLHNGSWAPAVLRGNIKGQKCSVCGIAHPVVTGVHPMHYCPSCGAYNGEMED